MKLFNRITIIGLGLIGGSLSLAIKEKHLAKEVIGVSRRRSTIQRALSLKIVDHATLNLKEGVKGSGLVILCTPVYKIVDIAERIAPLLKKGAILIDIGSTKKYITKKIEPILTEGTHFIGSHPLAGSEKSGVLSSDKNLFKGAVCILVKSARTNPQALAKIKRFWDGLGMKVIVMSPDAHDKIVSKISHLPHALAVSLVNSMDKTGLDLAAGGFRDTTRIASGEPELWKDIFLTNKDNLIKDIARFKKELAKIEYALKNDNKAVLLNLLNRAKVVRDSL